MLKIKKYDLDNHNKFIITTEEGSFSIAYGGTLDLFWEYIPTESLQDLPEKKIFTITKENYDFFQSIDELYNIIKNKTPLKEKDDDEFYQFVKDLGLEIKPSKKENDNAWTNLFHDNMIEWVSDSKIDKDHCKLQIQPEEETYKITFYKGMIDIFPSYTVRFSGSGSKNSPYEIPFMNMYNKLDSIEKNQTYHQMHIEEYLYQQKTYQKTKKGA